MVNHRAARSGLSSGTHAGRGAFPQGYMRTGATPPKAAGASDTVPDTGADTPRSPNRASGQKGGSLPSSPSPLARFGSSGPGRKTRTEPGKNGSGRPDTPTTVFLTPPTTCASDCARPRPRPPLRPRRGPDAGAASDRNLGRGQPNGGPDGEAVNRPARRRLGGRAGREFFQVQDAICRLLEGGNGKQKRDLLAT